MKPLFWPPLLLVALLFLTGAAMESELMKQKTDHASNILRYLALGDLAKVEYEAGALSRITRDAGFEDQGEHYAEYGEEFLRIVRALEKEAAERNMAGSYYEFSRMTGMCFSCHEHLRDNTD